MSDKHQDWQKQDRRALNPGPKRQPLRDSPDLRGPSAVFAAANADQCVRCYNPINLGDPIRYVSRAGYDGFMHAGCMNRAVLDRITEVDDDHSMV